MTPRGSCGNCWGSESMKTSNNPDDLSRLSLEPTQVKICGLTLPEEATACAELGAAAIGLVFYPPSPRFVTDELAKEICRALPSHVCTVGVFVNESFASIMKRVNRCGLKGVQLHGGEPPKLGEKLLREGLIVIRGLYINNPPSLKDADEYRASAYLVECAGGALPGGNALAWDWNAAAEIARIKPVVLAGGLNPDNVVRAIKAASPGAVDVSSGVEAAPGRKDINRVKDFLEAVRSCYAARENRKIF